MLNVISQAVKFSSKFYLVSFHIGGAGVIPTHKPYKILGRDKLRPYAKSNTVARQEP